jgi:hypothetical protein
MVYKDGYVYEGEWKNDMKNGVGTLKKENVNSYEGHWKDDKKDGSRGVFTDFISGDIFKGKY